jgi:hypothetical protein
VAQIKGRDYTVPPFKNALFLYAFGPGDNPSKGAGVGISFQNRRVYIHVGSRATSLSRSVVKRNTNAHTRKSIGTSGG